MNNCSFLTAKLVGEDELVGRTAGQVGFQVLVHRLVEIRTSPEPQAIPADHYIRPRKERIFFNRIFILKGRLLYNVLNRSSDSLFLRT